MLNIKVYICDEIISNKVVNKNGIIIPKKVAIIYFLKKSKYSKTKINILNIVLYGTGIRNLLIINIISKHNIQSFFDFLDGLIFNKVMKILTYRYTSIAKKGNIIILISSAFGFIKTFIIFCIVFIVIYNLQ